MRDQALSSDVVLVEPEVRRAHVEGLERLPGRKPLQPRYEDLDDEAAARLEMRCGVLEAGDLLVLRRQVHDRVGDEIGDRERGFDRRRGEVADRHADPLRAGLRTQSRHHRLGQIDPVHRYAALRERQRDPSRADAELERGTAAGEIRQEGDHGIDDGRIGLVRVPLVEALCHTLAEVVLGHARTLAKAGGATPVNGRYPLGVTRSSGDGGATQM